MNTPGVLVVDDDAPTCRLVRRILEADGLRVHEAHRGSDALVVASATSPDLVLLDLILPDASGLDLVVELRRRIAPHVPVLAFTGLLDDGAESRLAAAAFDDIVAKPVEPARLRAILRTYLPDHRAPAAAFGAGRQLLVVDDDVVQRKMVAFKLSRLGFDIIHAADGSEAIQIAQHRHPHAIISDVLMPRVDGFELCKRMRSDAAFARVPIVLLTNSYLEEGDRAHALRAGADAYLIRTPELRELTDVLRECLAHDIVRAAPVAAAEESPAERAARAVRQLDRQVAQNATLTRRATMLSAQLAVLGGFANALSERRSLSEAMDAALVSCFDAGLISWGVLIARDGNTWQHRSIGLFDPHRQHIEAVWERVLTRARAAPDPRAPLEVPMSELFDHAPSGTVLLAPMHDAGALSGVLVLRSTATFDEHRVGFAAAVAAQVGVALALERAFKETEAASREVAHQVAERSRELAVALTSDSSRVSAPDFATVGRFGARYRILRALGEGGMGAVFEVERTTDGRRLALKVMTGDVSREHAARFAREAEIGARVHAPHIVEILDIGVAEGGAPFLVMELVTGGSLEAYESRFGETGWALPILADVADGLASLHAAGVVHRDLKPANVLLDATGVAKVSDFGIARLGPVLTDLVDVVGPTQTPQGAWRRALTRTGAVLGTPFYMAPESARGGRAVGTPADVFAFGVLAYEVLAAQPVFVTPPVLLALASQPIPEPPPLGEHVPPSMRTTLRACLAEDPASRPPAARLSQELRTFGHHF